MSLAGICSVCWSASSGSCKVDVDLPEKADGLQNIENDRHGVNRTVLIPIRDFAKLKILLLAICWLEPGVPTTFFFFFFFFCVLGIMTAICPEMTGGGYHTFIFNVRYGFISKNCNCLMLV